MNTDDSHGGSAEPIEDYLDHLLLTLTGSPRNVRHTLAEVESHLRDSAAAARREGLDEVAAERFAVERMGPSLGVRDEQRLGRLLPLARRRRIVLVALSSARSAGSPSVLQVRSPASLASSAATGPSPVPSPQGRTPRLTAAGGCSCTRKHRTA